MAVRRKPRNVEDFIKQGGSSPKPVSDAPEGQAGPGFKNVRLRMREDLLEAVDQAVERRRSGIARHAWILEAIVEKLDREGGGG